MRFQHPGGTSGPRARFRAGVRRPSNFLRARADGRRQSFHAEHRGQIEEDRCYQEIRRSRFRGGEEGEAEEAEAEAEEEEPEAEEEESSEVKLDSVLDSEIDSVLIDFEKDSLTSEEPEQKSENFVFTKYLP